MVDKDVIFSKKYKKYMGFCESMMLESTCGFVKL